MKRYYLAYGSNLNREQMKFRCPTAKIIGTAVIEHHELFFRGSRTGAYLTIEPSIGRKVPVAVWEVTAADEKALDRYEGFPTFYYKQDFKIDVNLLDSGTTETLNCFAYIMTAGRSIGIPSDFYVQTCLDGYADFGFDKRILNKALEKARKNVCKYKKLL